MASVLLLDSNYTPINLITVKKSLKLIVKGKAEIVKSEAKRLHRDIFLPKVIRLINTIKDLYNRKLPFCKGNIFIRDNYTCVYCGMKLNHKSVTLDHILPRSKGGKNSWTNCVCCCKWCNGWKGDKLLSETNMTLMKRPYEPSLLDFFRIKFGHIEFDYA